MSTVFKGLGIFKRTFAIDRHGLELPLSEDVGEIKIGETVLEVWQVPDIEDVPYGTDLIGTLKTEITKMVTKDINDELTRRKKSNSREDLRKLVQEALKDINKSLPEYKE
jgi:hypothetical protein